MIKILPAAGELPAAIVNNAIHIPEHVFIKWVSLEK